MIGRITGVLVEKHPPQVTVDCHGVAYDIDVPMSTFCNLPPTGQNVALFTHLVVREDAHLLYGFASTNERIAFRELVKISGVGPRTALAVLSGLSVIELAGAITLQESARLTRVPGIGKKTAERLLLELKGKLGADLGAGAPSESESIADVRKALVSLGYSDKEVSVALRNVAADTSVSEGIREALRSLSKGGRA